MKKKEGEKVKEYQVSFRIKGMLHSYIVDARDARHARQLIKKSSPYPELITDLKAERYYQEWN